MRDAVIVGAVRTPVGRRGKGLAGIHPVDLSAHVLRALAERTGIDPVGVDDVIWGCVSQTGEQAVNIARNAVLAAGWPESVPATTIDRQCGSSQQAVHFAAAGVISGQYDVAVAGGVESMTRVPMLATVTQGPGFPFPPSLQDRYADRGGLVPQGLAAELVAQKWALSRERLDEIALRSHERALDATARGDFAREITPVPTIGPDGEPGLLAVDEGPRADTSATALAALPPAFGPDGGAVTAGNSSQISDGAAALLITTSEKARGLGLRPLARLAAFAVVGVDPVTMLTGPIPATTAVLDRAGLSLDDVGVVEVNEAFASVIGAWEAETGVDPRRLNPRGGAIALGHPLGASGARVMTTLLHGMLDGGHRYGLQAICEGGGMANATVLELL